MTLPSGWKAIDRLTAEHESGNARVILVPANPAPGRLHRRHFMVRVNGDWIYRRGPEINIYWTLEDAIVAAEKRL